MSKETWTSQSQKFSYLSGWKWQSPEITKQKSTFFKIVKLWPYHKVKWVILSLFYSWNFFDLTLHLKVSIKKSAFQASFSWFFFMDNLHNVQKA